MIAREGKAFIATQFGIDVIKSLGEHDIVSPVLTAVWSKRLKDIVDGSLSSSLFYKEMLQYVREMTARFIHLNMNVEEKQVTCCWEMREMPKPCR